VTINRLLNNRNINIKPSQTNLFHYLQNQFQPDCRDQCILAMSFSSDRQFQRLTCLEFVFSSKTSEIENRLLVEQRAFGFCWVEELLVHRVCSVHPGSILWNITFQFQIIDQGVFLAQICLVYNFSSEWISLFVSTSFHSKRLKFGHNVGNQRRSGRFSVILFLFQGCVSKSKHLRACKYRDSATFSLSIPEWSREFVDVICSFVHPTISAYLD